MPDFLDKLLHCFKFPEIIIITPTMQYSISDYERKSKQYNCSNCMNSFWHRLFNCGCKFHENHFNTMYVCIHLV